ncbi:Wzz/FepE/Etk N-terminal domain-containing protein [Saccharicrinis aurantiacus]|uniref:Wzz/FepE/Etk N-terminal domain-containing protein n=1 Tax=Saccharicrinis aurantiacus TaxID=1849719 RepID=UPI0015C569F9|nr:Wzz/FepE/Etk N-terminal domain-containing protein [Saccharicrinis aurantiacus]
MQQGGSNKIIEGDHLNIVALLEALWYGRKIIFRFIISFIVFALFIVIFGPEKYQAHATILPSSQQGTINIGGGGVGALAGMAGIDLSSMMGGSNSDGINAEVYPQIVESYPFRNEMIHHPFRFKKYKDPVSMYEYTVADTILSFTDKLLKYSIKLPWTVKELLISSNELIDTVNYGVINLSETEYNVLNSLDKFFTIEVDAKSGLVNISAEDTEPILVAQKLQKGLDLLQEYVKKHKTKREQQNVDFLENLYEIKAKEYKQAQIDFFEYKDKHRNTVFERANFEFQELSDRYDITSSIYKSVANQLETAKVTLIENTPIFTVIEPVQIPKVKSWPKKILLLFISVFFGFIFGSLWVLFRTQVALSFMKITK